MNKLKMVESYLDRGWGLTPVGAPKSGNENSGKNPFLPGWTQNPIRDMETGKGYWDNGKEYNVGVMTGEVSGLVVLDIDKPDMFEKFLEQFPECKNTYTVRRNNAPEWKSHYYFKLADFTPPSHNVETTGWGDLMCNGKQVVAPPSVHYTGGVYEVVNDAEPLPFKREYYDALLMAKKKPAKTKKKSSPGKEKVQEGERNNTLFSWGRQLRKQGMSKKEVEAAALEYCQECEPPYDEAEALKTVESVFSYNTPARRDKTLFQLNYFKEKSVDEDGETQPKAKPLPFNEVSDKVAALLQGKVANVYGELMQLPTTPAKEAIRLKTTADLFGYLGRTFKGVPDWSQGKNFMTKEELLSFLKEVLPTFEGIEKIPHFPPMKDIYYILPEPPKANMEILEGLLDFFSPETKYDRDLILAMFLTTLWGGPAGQRAPFLVTSKDGRGVGKSTLAETAAKLLNQIPIQASTRSDSNDLTKRLLSPKASKSRIVLFDNEVSTTQKIANAGMASLFTTGQISGHEMYKGEGTRPNYLIWIMTLNSVTLDSDFASRCIPIALKKPKESVNWQEKLNTFIEENRWTLIAMMIDLLKQKTEYAAPKTRWGLWENQVLTKVPGLSREAVLELVVSRQKTNDNDLDENEMIIDALMNLIEAQNKDMQTHRFFISGQDMAELVRDSLHLKQGNSWILRLVKDIIAKGDYPPLKKHDTNRARGFMWDESKNGNGKIIKLSWGTKQS